MHCKYCDNLAGKTPVGTNSTRWICNKYVQGFVTIERDTTSTGDPLSLWPNCKKFKDKPKSREEIVFEVEFMFEDGMIKPIGTKSENIDKCPDCSYFDASNWPNIVRCQECNSTITREKFKPMSGGDWFSDWFRGK